MFLLMILLSGFVFGKHLSINFRKFSPMFDFTFCEKGGLNQVIFRCLLFLFSLAFCGLYFKSFIRDLNRVSYTYTA